MPNYIMVFKQLCFVKLTNLTKLARRHNKIPNQDAPFANDKFITRNEEYELQHSINSLDQISTKYGMKVSTK